MRADVMGKLVLRPYTITELDQMRDALRVLREPVPGQKWRNGDRVTVHFSNGGVVGGASSPSPTMADIEDQLRTHMINGTDPVDLIAAAVDKTINDQIAVVDRCRERLFDPNPCDTRSLNQRLGTLRRAINKLEQLRTLNGR